jgi:acetate kinase
MQDGATQILTVNVGSSSIRFAGCEARSKEFACLGRVRMEGSRSSHCGVLSTSSTSRISRSLRIGSCTEARTLIDPDDAPFRK